MIGGLLLSGGGMMGLIMLRCLVVMCLSWSLVSGLMSGTSMRMG